MTEEKLSIVVGPQWCGFYPINHGILRIHGKYRPGTKKLQTTLLSDETGRLTKFIGWMELSRDTKTKMIEIETDDGEKLIMTDSHNVFYYKEDKPTPTYVKNLRPGNVLVGESGKVQQIHAFIEK